MKTSTQQVLTVLKVLAWIVFVALCLQTGTILFSFFLTLLYPNDLERFYREIDLSALHHHSALEYAFMGICLLTLFMMKSVIFYLIIKMFHEKRLRMPFDEGVVKFTLYISYMAAGVGFLAILIKDYNQRLVEKGIDMPTLELERFIGGGEEFLLLAGVVFTIAQVIKRGVEMQKENELTI
jgi:hypothetical protein